MLERSISPLFHALAGCGRRCATLSGWTGSPLRPATQFAISHHELIIECIFLASCIRLQKLSCPHGLWASLRHPVLQGNGVFAVDTEIVSQRRVSQQQHLSRDCPISQVFWCSLGTRTTMKSCLRHTAGMRVPRAYHLSDPQA